jgi:hypothetical protein
MASMSATRRPTANRPQQQRSANLFDTVTRLADYANRRRDIADFNASSRTQLRGLAMTPVKFGISFTPRNAQPGERAGEHLQDGTVIVTTGATEMGQGVNTRIRQLVADELGISYDAVIVPGDEHRQEQQHLPDRRVERHGFERRGGGRRVRPTPRSPRVARRTDTVRWKERYHARTLAHRPSATATYSTTASRPATA